MIQTGHVNRMGLEIEQPNQTRKAAGEKAQAKSANARI